MTTNEQIQKQNEAACVSVALKDRDSKAEAYSVSKYGSYRDEIINAHEAGQAEAKAENSTLFAEIIELSDSYADIECHRSEAMFRDKLEELLEKAKAAL
jgi:hypothetical protein